jgi:hypothetical protein
MEGSGGEMVSGTILLSGKHDAEEARAPGKWFLTPFPLPDTNSPDSISLTISAISRSAL